jgi:hypothetical protein
MTRSILIVKSRTMSDKITQQQAMNRALRARSRNERRDGRKYQSKPVNRNRSNGGTTGWISSSQTHPGVTNYKHQSKMVNRAFNAKNTLSKARRGGRRNSRATLRRR